MLCGCAWCVHADRVLHKHGAVTAGPGPCVELRGPGAQGAAAQRSNGQRSRSPHLAVSAAAGHAAVASRHCGEQQLGYAAGAAPVAADTPVQWHAGGASDHWAAPAD